MEATKTPVDPGLIARVVAGVRYAITGKEPDWFGPGQPLTPVAQTEARGRQYDYPVSHNLRQRPRQEEPISFAQMRALADGYDLLRIVIETRKDQVCDLAWTVQPKDEKAKQDARCDELQAFLAFPDKEHTWRDWLRMIVEDLLVIDAATIYPRMTLGGGLYSLDPMDGSTIKRLIDQTGRTPVAPDPAYQQVLKGLPAVDYSRDELIYRPRNVRTHKLYGYSPVEQIIATVNVAIRRQLHQLQFYTAGSVPDALASVPKEWGPEQIAQFQAYWDSLLEGDTARRRHMRFIPDGVTYKPTKENALKDEYDEWLARIVCFAFSIEPTPFIKQQNRATAETARSQSLSEGLSPLKSWVKSLIDGVIVRYFGYADLEFKWLDNADIDPLTQAQIDQIYLASKVVHPDEIRYRIGLDPLTTEQKQDLTEPAPNAAADSKEDKS